MTKTAKRRPLAGAEQIMAGMRELEAALDRGRPLSEVLTVREISVPEPGAYDASRIRHIRDRLRVSQGVFARIVGVSRELVEHWEQGVTTPRPIARRLLDQINRDPQAFLAALAA